MAETAGLRIFALGIGPKVVGPACFPSHDGHGRGSMGRRRRRVRPTGDWNQPELLFAWPKLAEHERI